MGELVVPIFKTDILFWFDGSAELPNAASGLSYSTWLNTRGEKSPIDFIPSTKCDASGGLSVVGSIHIPTSIAPGGRYMSMLMQRGSVDEAEHALCLMSHLRVSEFTLCVCTNARCDPV